MNSYRLGQVSMKLSDIFESDNKYALYFDYTGVGRGPEPIAGPFPSRKDAEHYASDEGYDLTDKHYFVDVYTDPDRFEW